MEEEEMSVGRIMFRKNCENFSKNFTIYMLHKPFQKVDCMSKYNVRRFSFFHINCSKYSTYNT